MSPTLIEVELAIRLHEGDGRKIVFVFLDSDNNVEFTMLTTILGIQWVQENLPEILGSVTHLMPGDPVPENGGPYEPTVFDDDKYGRHIGGFTDNVNDTYNVSGDDGSHSSIEVPVGTPLAEVYARIESSKPAIPNLVTSQADKIIAFGIAVRQYVEDKYAQDKIVQLQNLYTLAKEDGLTNQAAYIRALFVWLKSVIVYSATFVTSVEAENDPATVVDMNWDIDSNIAADPLVTLAAAIQISD